MGPGLGGETDMTGATGFLDVAEDSRSPAEYGERTTAMVRLCMFLHFYCILTSGAAQPPSGNSTRPDCTSGSFECQKVCARSELSSEEQSADPFAGCLFLPQRLNQTMCKCCDGFCFFDGLWMVLSFQCFNGLEFFLAFPDLKLNSLQGLAHLSMMTATRWHAITLKCA